MTHKQSTFTGACGTGDQLAHTRGLSKAGGASDGRTLPEWLLSGIRPYLAELLQNYPVRSVLGVSPSLLYVPLTRICDSVPLEQLEK